MTELLTLDKTVLLAGAKFIIFGFNLVAWSYICLFLKISKNLRNNELFKTEEIQNFHAENVDFLFFYKNSYKF